METKERNVNADLIRCVAVFSVISVHFLKNTGFYGVPVEGGVMLFQCIFRSFFMVCVPLFMILTGYLMWQKTLSRRYYRGICKTLEIYVLASIACLLFKKFALGYHVTWMSAILGILDFDAANYAWYIEMYIGLFLMIPFLNLAYHGLKDKRQKQALVLTMMALTLLPKILNNFNFTAPGWWAAPSQLESYDPLVPAFFTAMYPITYYFIGAYLREFGAPFGRRLSLLLWILSVLAFGCYNYYRSFGVNFIWGSNNTWGGENLITASFLFMLLLGVRTGGWPRAVKRALAFVSGISLGLYLISWIADIIIYDNCFNLLVPEVERRIFYYPLVAPAVFLLSMLFAVILYLVQAAFGRLKLSK